MPTISTPDGETWHLTTEQRAALTRLLSLPPDRFDALLVMIEQQAVFDAMPDPPHRVELPIFSPDGDPVMPISCRPRMLALSRGEDPPRCTWRRDEKAGGYTCSRCSGWIVPESPRTQRLDAMLAMKAGGGDE